MYFSPTPPQPSTSPFQYSSQKITTISSVHDGDTVYSKDLTEGIRLIGIDAPELAYSYINCRDNSRVVPTEKCTQNECGAIEAKSKLKELILNKNVILEADPNLENKDKYNRLLRYVLICPPTYTSYPSSASFTNLSTTCQDMSLLLIEQGLAKEASFGTNYSKKKEYQEAELEAKRENLGIWNICN